MGGQGIYDETFFWAVREEWVWCFGRMDSGGVDVIEIRKCAEKGSPGNRHYIPYFYFTLLTHGLTDQRNLLVFLGIHAQRLYSLNREGERGSK